MASLNTATAETKNVDDLDPHLGAMLDRKRKKLTSGEYRPLAKDEVTAALNRLLSAHHISDASVEDVHRLAGGGIERTISVYFGSRQWQQRKTRFADGSHQQRSRNQPSSGV